MVRYRPVRMAAACAAAVLVSVTAAQARPPAACANDIAKLCADVPRSGGPLVLCLYDHAGQLSPECKHALDQKTSSEKMRRDRRNLQARAWVTPCTGDIKKFCAGLPAGAGHVVECLGKHQAELSAQCKAVFPPKDD